LTILRLAMTVAAVNLCASACAAQQTRDLPPQWNALMLSGNRAAMRGDLTSAIRYWSKLDRYAVDKCDLAYAHINVQAAREALAEAHDSHTPRTRLYERYRAFQDKHWQGHPCNR
jgi:hypothetical protein